jgi:NAD(P)-dependent dehydrogenase (short-subunit alcohol dehydrogenase family)
VELARRGARLVVSDIDLETARATAKELGPIEAHAVRCDVGRLEQVQALCAEADRLLGGTDLLVNNAGVGGGGRVGEIPVEDWDWLLRIDLWGPIYGCHVFVPRFRQQGSGHILNVASAAGLLSAPMMAPYNVAKAGVIALSETLRGELFDEGIGVTVLCPTFFQTNILNAARGGGEQMMEVARKLMADAKLTAADVARMAVDGVESSALYVVPQQDGRWMWRAKRLLPQRFYHLVPRVLKWHQARSRKQGPS